MRQNEASRVDSLVHRLGKQEHIMADMAVQRREVQMVREEQRRLRSEDRQENVARMARAREFAAKQLMLKQQREDEREAQRKARTRELIESHIAESREAALQKQRVVRQLDKAIGNPEALAKLLAPLSPHSAVEH